MTHFYQQSNRLSLSHLLRQNDKDNAGFFTVFLSLVALAALGETGFTLYKGFYGISAYFMGIVFFCVGLALYINFTQRFPPMRYLLVGFSTLIGTTIYLEGISANGFVYFFPFLLAPLLASNPAKPFRQAGLPLLVSALFFIAAIFSTKDMNGLLVGQQPTAQDYQDWFRFKLLMTFLLSVANLVIGFGLARLHEMALMNGKSYFNTLFNTSLDAYIIIHKDTIVNYNQRTVALFQMDNPASFKKLSHTRWLYRHLVLNTPGAEKVINENPVQWEGELTFVTLKGKSFQGQMSVMPFAYNNEEYLKVSIRDVSHLKAVETELVQAREKAEQASLSKARFLSSMSHELRTPLNGIIGTANLLLQEKGLPADLLSHIDVLKYSSDHMLGIINDILDFSKIEAGKMELHLSCLDLKLYLDKVVGLFEPQLAAKGLGFSIDIDPQLGGVQLLFDEVKLGQVLHNLLSNALKYTIQGQVGLKVSATAISPHKRQLYFEVSDTGVGIPPERIPDIFEGFTQVQTRTLAGQNTGTGLGLSISQKLVELFGGELLAESEPDKGSRFSFSVLFEVDTTVRNAYCTTNIHVRPDSLLRGLRVLLVEDNAINMKVAKGFLRKWNANIKEAGNGIEALELAKYHAFDIVLMDLDMPEMDGYTATRLMRAQGFSTPILAFTAALVDDLALRLKQAGFDGFILKPFKPNDLYEKIEHCLKTHVVFV